MNIQVTFSDRDAKVKEMTVHKLEEMEKKLSEADKSRGQTDRDIKTVRHRADTGQNDVT